METDDAGLRMVASERSSREKASSGRPVEAPHGRHLSLEASRVALESLVEGRLRGHRPPDALEGDPIGEQVWYLAGLGAAAPKLPARKEGSARRHLGMEQVFRAEGSGRVGAHLPRPRATPTGLLLAPSAKRARPRCKRTSALLGCSRARSRRRSTVPAGHEATAAPTAAGMDEGFVPRIVSKRRRASAVRPLRTRAPRQPGRAPAAGGGDAEFERRRLAGSRFLAVQEEPACDGDSGCHHRDKGNDEPDACGLTRAEGMRLPVAILIEATWRATGNSCSRSRRRSTRSTPRARVSYSGKAKRRPSTCASATSGKRATSPAPCTSPAAPWKDASSTPFPIALSRSSCTAPAAAAGLRCPHA